MNLRDEAAFDDIVQAATSILRYTRGKKRAFATDAILQDAVVRRFEVMGEAVKRLSSEFRAAHPEIPWRQIAGFRDVLIHGYDEVRPHEVWAIVEGPLTEVLEALKGLRHPPKEGTAGRP